MSDSKLYNVYGAMTNRSSAICRQQTYILKQVL